MKRMLWMIAALACCLLCAAAAAEGNTPDFVYELHEAEGYSAAGSAVIEGDALRVTVSISYDPDRAAADGPSAYTVYVNESPAGTLPPTQWENGGQRPTVFEGVIPCQAHISVLEVYPLLGNGNGGIEDYRNSFYLFPTSGMRRYTASARMESGYTVDALFEEYRETAFRVRVNLDWTQNQDDVIRSFNLYVNGIPQDFQVTGVWDGEAVGPAKEFMTAVFIQGQPERLQLVPIYENRGEQRAEAIEVPTTGTLSSKPTVLGTATVEGASWVHLRSAPTFAGVSLAKIDRGDRVQVTALAGDWLGVIADGKTGYMLASLLSPVTGQIAPEAGGNVSNVQLAYTALPAQAEQGVSGKYAQTLTDPAALASIWKWISEAEPMDFSSKCPFGYAFLTITLADGAEITLDLAVDSCSVFVVNGQYYSYQPREFRNTGEGPNNEILFDLFPEIPRLH